MRIIAGQWKGRVLKDQTPKTTRPMGDKIRGALFNVLGDVEGQSVLDVYAGTGAVGLEALSRGALLIEAIEKERATAKIIQVNANDLAAGERFQLWQMTVEDWLLKHQVPGTRRPEYDLIIADPPYTKIDETVIIRLSNYLKPTGILVLSHASKQKAPELEGLQTAQSKNYGDSALTFYLKM